MNLSEKIEVAKRLEKLGVDIIEAGFPISSSGDFDAVKSISAFRGTASFLTRYSKRSIKAYLAAINAMEYDLIIRNEK